MEEGWGERGYCYEGGVLVEKHTGCCVTTLESTGTSMGCCCWTALTSGILVVVVLCVVK